MRLLVWLVTLSATPYLSWALPTTSAGELTSIDTLHVPNVPSGVLLPGGAVEPRSFVDSTDLAGAGFSKGTRSSPLISRRKRKLITPPTVLSITILPPMPSPTAIAATGADPPRDIGDVIVSISSSSSSSDNHATSTTISYHAPLQPPSPISPPKDFSGTQAGFATTCTVRYTDPVLVPGMSWGGNSGNVTREEIESALGSLLSTPAVLSNGIGSLLADGYFGQASLNSGLLYEITGDIRTLDLAMRLSSNILALQNPKDTGQIMWTGNREPVWPTQPVFPLNTSVLPYAGAEQGEIVAAMVNVAKYILEKPCLWNLIPITSSNYVGGAGPDAFGPNDTYLTRALALIAAGEETYQKFILPNFLDVNHLLIQPNTTLWNLVGDGNNLAGQPMAWNRRGMILHGLLRLSSLQIYPQVPVSNAGLYDQIIIANIQDFISNLQPTKASNGVDTYNWNYKITGHDGEAVSGIHGFFDLRMLFMAWQRNATLYGITEKVMQTLANTLQYTVHHNGTSNAGHPRVEKIWAGFSFLGHWSHVWYNDVASANSAKFPESSWISIPLLWTKNALSTGVWKQGI